MTYRLPVVPQVQWFEGMLLVPQHFQQATLRSEQLLAFHWQTKSPYHWGIKTLAIDSLVLSSGLLRILELEAILPDGTLVLYKAPMEGIPPLELDLAPFKAELQEHQTKTVYLAMPEAIEGLSPVVGEWPRYYSLDGVEVRDDNVFENVVNFPRLFPRLSLIASDAPPSRYVSFPILGIKFEEEVFQQTDFIAPYFSTTLASPLGLVCSKIAQRAREKASFLAQKWHNQVGTSLIAETAHLLRPLLQVLPGFEALIQSGTASPFELYVKLCDVAGILASIRLSKLPPVFSAYQHNNILQSFRPVLDFVDSLLESIEQNYKTFLFKKQDRFFSHRLFPEYVSASKNLIVGVKAPAGMSEGALAEWILESIISTDGAIESVRNRRVTGAPRQLVVDDSLFELMPGKGVMLFQITCEEEYIRIGENLHIFNPADQEEKRPLEMVLYVPTAKEPSRPKGE